MVDYTKDVMRDETWRRWKGGQKLADELKAFYTNKRVFDRLAISNPMGPTLPASVAQPMTRGDRLKKLGVGRNVPTWANARAVGAIFGGLGATAGEAKERAAARQSGATLNR